MTDNANAPTCPACGVPYGDHLGLHGTCAEVQQLRASLWPLANALGIQGDPPPDWLPDVALLVEATCKDMTRQRTEVQRLRTKVEHLTTNATAREGVLHREGDLLRAAQRERDELRDEVARLRAALVDSQRLYGAAHARAGALGAALTEALGWMTESGHPWDGLMLRSGWVPLQRVAKLRRLVDGAR